LGCKLAPLVQAYLVSEGRYRKAHLMAALSNFEGSFRYRVIALLEKLGGVVWLVRDFGLFRRRVAIRNEAFRPEIDACVRGQTARMAAPCPTIKTLESGAQPSRRRSASTIHPRFQAANPDDRNIFLTLLLFEPRR
jgi:hypothetical protein